jgi:type IV pilus assembly protein PilN
MYSLDVNFLKDRERLDKGSEKKPKKSMPVGDMTPLYIGLGIGLCLPIFVGAGWFILQTKSGELQSNITQLEQKNQELEAKIGDIKKISAEVTAVKGETQALVTVFDQIRPWSAMLLDIKQRIPGTVQLDSVKQVAQIGVSPNAAPTTGTIPTSGVEINGFARSFNDVNDFLLTMKQSRFFNANDARISSAESVPAQLPSDVVLPPGFKPPQVIKYTIQTNLSDIRASELIRELEEKGTVGLVARIRSLQQTGALPK